MFEILKGTKDSLPKEQIRINRILNIIRKEFESYGFRPFDTPVIEYFETLVMKYDVEAEIVQEIFKLSDRGGRALGLRYDLTTSLSRFIASQKQLRKPFRRYQIGKVFRDGPIKKERLREFIQCDGDVVGIGGRGIEAELLMMFFETYKTIGLEVVIEINNNKILRGAFLQSGFDEKDVSSLILSVDKLKKIGIDGVLVEIEKKNLDMKMAKNAIEILKLDSIEAIENIAVNIFLKEGVGELKELAGLIKPYVKFRINFSMSRGLDIYTGNIWEVYEMKEKISSSIGSGGRFDKIIGEYSGSKEEIPAVGVSFGIVPMMACFDDKENVEGVTDILVVPLEDGLLVESFEIAKMLRKNGRSVEMYYGYKLKRAFDYAQYLGAREVVIFGNKDKENNEYTLKNMSTGIEKKVKF